MSDACANCRFWFPKYGVNDRRSYGPGYCRRHAPRSPLLVATDHYAASELDGFWPKTKGEDWCGDYETRPEIAAELTQPPPPYEKTP
jgi:hypothetical protein